MKKWLAVLCAVLLAVTLAGCEKEIKQDEEFEYYTNGGIVFGVFDIDVWLLGSKGAAAYQEMLVELESINTDTNLNIDTPLRYLNEEAAVGEAVEVGVHAYTLMQLSIQYHEKTGGAFNIAMQTFSEMWRVDSASTQYFYRNVGLEDFALPSFQEVAAALQALQDAAAPDAPFGVEAFQQNDKYYFKKLGQGVKIDFGAIAKGYAVEVCMDIALAHGITSAYIGIANHNKIYGQFHNPDTREKIDFLCAVTHPRTMGIRGNPFYKANLFTVPLRGEVSIIASGDYERFYYYEMQEEEFLPVCHIINPFTGMPIGISFDNVLNTYVYDADAVISAVIFDPSANTAEAFSTAATVYSFEDAKSLLIENRIKSAVMTENHIAFIGISEADLYMPDSLMYSMFISYESNVEFIPL
ncbi:MAG: FAD:protein FMN transferase [Firmicutes bacterium]|nr:FAD:protein FMN transferase [Bacillota bacterium]